MAYNSYMHKKADGGIGNDRIGADMTGKIPVIGGLANIAGPVMGYMAGAPSEETLESMDRHPGLSYVPGIGSYRIMRKTLATSKVPGARTRILTETIGPTTSTMGAVILAAALGVPFGPIGMLAGGAIGYASANAAEASARRSAEAQKRRTAREQDEADRSEGILANLFIPGVAAYRAARRLLAITREEDRRNEKAESQLLINNQA